MRVVIEPFQLKRRAQRLYSADRVNSEAQGGVGVVVKKPLTLTWVKQPLVKILEVVANIQMRTLKTGAEKVPCEQQLDIDQSIL